MKEIILIKNGELALKGLNRSTFEDILIKNMRRRLKSLGEVTIRKAQSTIYVEPQSEDFDFDEALNCFDEILKIRPGHIFSLVQKRNIFAFKKMKQSLRAVTYNRNIKYKRKRVIG